MADSTRTTLKLTALGAAGARAIARSPAWLAQPRAAAIGAVLIVMAGGALRFWNLASGVPYRVGFDEPTIAQIAVHMMKTGDFNPHFFDYPGLYIYLQVIIACARFISGALAGLWDSLDQFGHEHLYLWARAVNAVIGTGTIVLVYRIGTRWGRSHALLAAALMAVFLNHVRESHFALTDVPLTFLTTLTLLQSLRAHEIGRTSSFLAAGAMAGLATATKYNGLVALALPIIAALLAPADWSARARRLAGIAAACGGAFLLAAPYTVLDLPSFLNAFARLSRAYQARGDLSGFLIYAQHVRIALGWPGVTLLGAGMMMALGRALGDRARLRWILLVAFPALYMDLIATKQLLFARYMLPAVPFFCLLAGVFVASLFPRIGRVRSVLVRRTAIAALGIALLAYPTIAAVSWSAGHGRPTTEKLAYDWIVRLVPEQSRIVIEGFVVSPPATRYRTGYVDALTERPRHAYVSEGFEFMVASSRVFGPILAEPARDPDRYAAYQRLFGASERLMVIRPTDRLPGPEIRIYRLRP